MYEFPIKIGIIGGGQLGKMMALQAKKMGFYVAILDPTFNCPASSIVDKHIIADFNNKEKITELAKETNVVTYEFEHIDANILIELEKKGTTIYPSPKTLLSIQNKFVQKNILREHSLPVPEYIEINNLESLKNASNLFGFPFMLKTCVGGYDGKGNYLIKNFDDINEGFNQLGSGKIPLMCEKFVDFTMEISVIVCRDPFGNVATYPVGENIHKNSILDITKVPANINSTVYEKAISLASKSLKIFEGVGIFCVEMFVTKDDNVLINEIAPRPHNSGHYTIEGCVTSQFEQHILAICGLPLGETTLLRPTVMKNLLGSENYTGKTYVKGIKKALENGAKLHIYGKSETKPFRKMGHLTVTSNTIENAVLIAESAFKEISIISV